MYILQIITNFILISDETPANNSQLGKFHEVTDAFRHQTVIFFLIPR